jgi:polar amino acid transport system substrate-binding protein
LNVTGLALLLALTFKPEGLAQEQVNLFPQFRTWSLTDQDNKPGAPGKVTLLADQDFAPWSFAGADGKAQGLAVDLALSACAEIAADCNVRQVPFVDLLPSLSRGEGDMIITGLRLTHDMVLKDQMTRPYFVSMGRFVMRQGSPLSAPDAKSLAGRKIGHVRGTSHEIFIQAHYSRSELLAYDDAKGMLEALRTGQIDAAFGDAMALAFWLKGDLSRQCCVSLGRSFVDRTTFSRSLSFLAKRDERKLAEAFDYALDRLEEKKITADIFTRYLPERLW